MRPKRDQNVTKTRPKRDQERDQNISSSSSYLNTTTTKSTCVKNEADFDKSTQLSEKVIIPDVIKKIGFGKTQLDQIKKIGKLSVEELQHIS